ncbi:unnamed protein product [Aphis gossypii]|uniref:Uncharacterized protein n=1 Tax=Aphis gossypii TaxID=80765 RepID=A0A9P0NTE4_APHGO|nr:unnamed protein product [Aphis gossypii]
MRRRTAAAAANIGEKRARIIDIILLIRYQYTAVLVVAVRSFVRLPHHRSHPARHPPSKNTHSVRPFRPPRDLLSSGVRVARDDVEGHAAHRSRWSPTPSPNHYGIPTSDIDVTATRYIHHVHLPTIELPRAYTLTTMTMIITTF